MKRAKQKPVMKDFLQILKEQHGISYGWMANAMGLSIQDLNYLRKRGIPRKRARLLESALQLTSKSLRDIRIPEDYLVDYDMKRYQKRTEKE